MVSYMGRTARITAGILIVTVLSVILMSAMPSSDAAFTGSEPASSGDTAWILICTILVSMMLPGVAFFYGGMLRKQSMTSIMAQTLIAAGIMTLSWVILGYSLAFGSSGGFIGNLDFVFMNGLDEGQSDYSVMEFALFQMMFAVLTAAIILGACAERVRFVAIAWFLLFWGLLVYVPMAHWVWSGGFESIGLTVLDFAGGDVVHICAAVSGLALVMFVGNRKDSVRRSRAHSVPLTFLGAMMLWVGWFGFNGGSGIFANGQAVHAIFVSQLAAAAAMIAWAVCQYMVVGRVGVLGLIAGAVSGLVAITPGAGYVGTPEAFVIGLVGGALCFWSVRIIHARFSLDDALDVFGVHGVGGIWGGIAVGLFAESKYTGGTVGLLFGSTDLFVGQLCAIAITIVFCFAVSYMLALLLSKVMPLRIPAEEESIGQDVVEHGEPAYFS